MKTIVTHIGPDLDAITSVWLIKTFFQGWEEAALAFVPAGTTLENHRPDDNPDIIHTDTGYGKFDHHQTNDDVCAAMLVYEEVKKQKGPDIALERLIAVVNDTDHFREVFFPNPTADFWDITVISMIDGWRLLFPDDSNKVVQLGMDALDGIYKAFQNKLWAEKEIAEKGIPFETKWGKGLAVETTNDDVIHRAQKMGHAVVVRKDPKKGYVRIKAFPKPETDLSDVYHALSEKDKEATWFLHVSHHMLLNGSTKNPDMRPSKLTLQEIIEVLKSV